MRRSRKLTLLAVAGVAAVSLTAVAAASGAKPKPKPKPKPPPSFLVSVNATYSHEHTETVVYRPEANGCHFRWDLSGKQTVTATTPKPVLRTFAQVTKGGAFAPLSAVEQRSGSARSGWEPGCPALAGLPPDIEDTSACGQQSYTIPAAETSLGYLGSATSTRFAFGFARNGADPYGGNCLAAVYVDEGSDEQAPTSTVDFPGPLWGTASGERQDWFELARTKLTTATKPLVLSWSDTASTSQPYFDPDPKAYDTNVTTDSYTVSWQVTLTPVKAKTVKKK